MSFTTNTKVPAWLTCTAAAGTVTRSSVRSVSAVLTSVPGHSSSFSFGIVARTVTMPVAGSTVFSIIVTWPVSRASLPGTIASSVAVSAASAARTSGRLRCGTVKDT